MTARFPRRYPASRRRAVMPSRTGADNRPAEPAPVPEGGVLGDLRPDQQRRDEKDEGNGGDQVLINGLEHGVGLRVDDDLSLAGTGKETVNRGSLLRPASKASPLPPVGTPEHARVTRANADYYRRVLRPFAALLVGALLTLAPAAAEASGSLQGLLREMRSRYGSACCKVISGYRPGAMVLGTQMPSCHASREALDLILSAPAKAHVLRTRFGIIRYRSGHWHVSSCRRELGIRAFK